MAKKNNNLIIGIVVAVVVVIAIIIGVVVATKKGGDGGTGGEPGGGTSSQKIYDTIDVEVGYGDYEVMEAQAKAIQNGEMMGKVVRIDGIVIHPMSKYSIGEAGESNGLKIGTEFEIEGASEGDYPKDGDHVVITGEVVEKSPMYFIIKTTPENVVVLETAE